MVAMPTYTAMLYNTSNTAMGLLAKNVELQLSMHERQTSILLLH
jgi:hypothetical protein